MTDSVAEAAAPGLVNQLAGELAQAQRGLVAAQRKLATTTRTLQARTQELTEARAALALLLVTLDTSSEAMMALGHFGRVMHFNRRFVELWRIPEEKVQGLCDSALLTLQLAQVCDPGAFLAEVEARRRRPDAAHESVVALTDGRVLAWRTLPHCLHGKRVGCVTAFRELSRENRPTPA